MDRITWHLPWSNTIAVSDLREVKSYRLAAVLIEDTPGYCQSIDLVKPFAVLTYLQIR